MAPHSSQGSWRLSFCPGNRVVAGKPCIAVARYVKHGVAADVAVVQVVKDFQLPVHIEVIVQVSNQLFVITGLHRVLQASSRCCLLRFLLAFDSKRLYAGKLIVNLCLWHCSRAKNSQRN